MPTVFVNGGTLKLDPFRQVTALDFPQGACSITSIDGDPVDDEFRVYINGVGFGASQGIGDVDYGGVAQTVLEWTDTRITIEIDRTGLSDGSSYTLTVTTNDQCEATEAMSTTAGATCNSGNATITLIGEHPTKSSLWEIEIDADCVNYFVPTDTGSSVNLANHAEAEVTIADTNTSYAVGITGGTIVQLSAGHSETTPQDVAQALVDLWNADSDLSEHYTASRDDAHVVIDFVELAQRVECNTLYSLSFFGTGSMETDFPDCQGDETSNDSECLKLHEVVNDGVHCTPTDATAAGFKIPVHDRRHFEGTKGYWKSNTRAYVRTYNMGCPGCTCPDDGIGFSYSMTGTTSTENC